MSSRVDILLIFHHFRTPKQRGGLRSYHIVKKLVQAGNSVVTVVPGVDTLSGIRDSTVKGRFWAKSSGQDIGRIIKVNSFDNIRTSKFKRTCYYLSFSLLQFLVSLTIRKPRIVITTSIPLSSLILAWIISQIKGAKLLVDVRDLSLDTATELGYFADGLFVRTCKFLESFVFRQADQVIVVSKGMGRFLQAKGVLQENIFFVPIGFDGDDIISHDQFDVCDTYKLQGKFVVLYAGTLGHVVDIDIILESAYLLRADSKVHFLIVGDGQRLPEYKSRADKLGLNIIFAGQHPKNRIKDFCLAADICLYPLNGGQVVGTLAGNKIYDYLGNGCPVIYSGPEGDVAELITKNNLGSAVPRDAKSLTGAIKEWQLDPEKLKDASKRARQVILEKYTISQSMERFSNIVSQINE